MIGKKRCHGGAAERRALGLWAKPSAQIKEDCFPDGQSVLMLVAARLGHIAGTKWGLRKYLSMELLQAKQKRKTAS